MSATSSSQTSLRREQGYFALCLLLLGTTLALSSSLLLGGLTLGIYAVLYGMERGRWWELTRRLLLLGFFLLLSLLPVALGTAPAGERLLLDFGGWGVGEVGYLTARTALLRCYGAVGSMMLLLRLLPLYRLYAVLRSLGIPKLFIELVELTYRYIFLLEETAAQIRLAQTSRLGYQGPLRRRMEHFGLLLARTFILSQTESDRLYLGLVSRGYEDDAPMPAPSSAMPAESIPPTPLIQALDLTFSYRPGHTTLDQLSLSIQHGERIALLGHNGAGKSTLFLLLAGLQEQWQGELRLGGATIAPQERTRLRRTIALVLQNSNYQLFTPSVEDEIAFGLKNLGLQGQALQERLEALLNQYDLQGLRHKPPHQLSEGQKKWVALVAILATEPEVLLLDEPTAALDQRYTRRVLQLLDELSRAGKTILLSTHDMELASQFAQRVLLLDGGKLRADRPARDFWADRALLDEAELDQPYAWRSASAPTFSPASPSPAHPPKYHLPLFLSADLLPVLFIGGGQGIWRKAQGLLERGLPFTILADQLTPALQEAHQAGRFTWLAGRYSGSEDLSAYRIIVCGIGDADQERHWSERWRQGGFLYALLSDPEGGNIQFGATSQREGITLAVHSDYRLPEIAVLLRDSWAGQLPDQLEEELRQLATLRRHYLSTSLPEERAVREQTYQQAKRHLLEKLIR